MICDSIACLSDSPQRLQILDALDDACIDLRDLKAELDCPRTTLQRNLSVLEQYGWVEQRSSGYATTTAGCLVLAEFVAMNRTVETINAVKPFLDTVDTPTEIDIGRLDAPLITVPEPGRPNAPTKRLFEAFAEADRVQGFLPFVSSLLVELAGTDRYVAVEQEYVVSRAGLDALYEQYADESAAVPGADRSASHIKIRSCDDDLPYGLFVSDDRLALAGYDEIGRIKALVESTGEESIEWGEDTYETYREGSEPHEKEILG